MRIRQKEKAEFNIITPYHGHFVFKPYSLTVWRILSINPFIAGLFNQLQFCDFIAFYPYFVVKSSKYKAPIEVLGIAPTYTSPSTATVDRTKI